MDPAVEAKAALRRQALAARAAVPDRAARERRVQATLADIIAARFAQATVAAYAAMRDEIDPLPALAGCAAVGLPVVLRPATPLVFRRWTEGQPLEPGLFGTRHPPETAPEVVPTLILMPLAGFDRDGNRLGYGGGFYDRTLAVLRARGPVTAIGLAFAAQEVGVIPVEATDEPLDGIVTEDGLRDFTAA